MNPIIIDWWELILSSQLVFLMVFEEGVLPIHDLLFFEHLEHYLDLF